MKHADDTVSNLENLETLITTLSKKTGKHHCIQKQFTERAPGQLARHHQKVFNRSSEDQKNKKCDVRERTYLVIFSLTVLHCNSRTPIKDLFSHIQEFTVRNIQPGLETKEAWRECQGLNVEEEPRGQWRWL